MFSPYEPWQVSPHANAQAPPPCARDLSVLQADVDFGALLGPALQVDLQRAVDNMDESEGIEAWPAPADDACAPIESPLSTPPSSLPPSPCSSTTSLPPRTTPANADPTASLPSVEAPPSARKLKQRAGKKARQARSRLQGVANPLLAKVKPVLSRAWQSPKTLQAAFSVSLLPGTGGGFTGQRMRLAPRDRALPHTLQELRDMGFRLVEWDGR